MGACAAFGALPLSSFCVSGRFPFVFGMRLKPGPRANFALARAKRAKTCFRARARENPRARAARLARPGLPAPTDERWGGEIAGATRLGKQNPGAPRRLFPAQIGHLPSFPEEDSAWRQRHACPRQTRTPQRIQAPWLRKGRTELPPHPGRPRLSAHSQRSGAIAQILGPSRRILKARLGAAPKYEAPIL